jgi:hypothetical protein
MIETNRELAPIALFVYKRLTHTQKTVEALLGNNEAKQSQLIIFSDAAKTIVDVEDVEMIRSYIQTIKGFKSIRIVERSENYGLAQSVIAGVTALCESHGRVIVLEDDLETSPYFLRYMNEALDKFEKKAEIGSISGYMYPVSLDLNEDVFYASAPQSWGWATWDRAWQFFQRDSEKLIDKIKETRSISQFNANGPHSYSKMLERQMNGKSDSWFIRWYASCFINDMKTVMPRKTLIRNIGIDGTGTHCAEWRFDPFDGELARDPADLKTVVGQALSQENLRLLSRFYSRVMRLRYVNFLYRVLAKIKVIK